MMRRASARRCRGLRHTGQPTVTGFTGEEQMTRRIGHSLVAAPLTLFFAGCATVPPKGGFDDVQTLVAERSGESLHWNQGTPEDAAVDERVRAFLKGELTADAATQIALLRNPSLQATYETLGVSQADMVQAGLLANPVFSATLRPVIRGPSGTNLELDLAQNFLQLLMLPARKKLARTQFDEAKFRVAHEVLAFASEVRGAYYELQAARHVVEVLRTATDAAGVSAELSARLHDAGNVSDLTLARGQSLYEDARLTLMMAEADVTPLREQLSRLMGLRGDEGGWRVPAQLPPLPGTVPATDELERLAFSKRLDLRAAAKEIEVLRQALSLAKFYRWIPFAEVGVSSERDPDGSGVWVLGPSLSLELPIFDQGHAKLARLEAQLREAEKRLSAIELDMRSRVREARARLELARALIERYRSTVVPLRERIVALSLQEYNFMLIGAFELLSAKRDEIDAYRGYVDALRDFWISYADLRQAIGGEFPLGEPERIAPPSPERDLTPPPMHDHHRHDATPEGQHRMRLLNEPPPAHDHSAQPPRMRREVR